jgi:hypothetical protein
MNGTIACPDDPRYILDERMCLYPVSKDLTGELRLEETELEECRGAQVQDAQDGAPAQGDKLRIVEPSAKGGSGPAQGVIEGTIVCPCG